MTRLLRAEFRRLFSRRMTLLGLLGALSLILVFSWANWSSTTPPDADEIAQQQAFYEQARKDWEAYDGPAQLAECKKQATSPTPDPQGAFAGMSETDCDMLVPNPEAYRWVPPTIEKAIAGVPLATSFTLGLIAIVLAASFVGAEFSTGAIGNWLTYEPRRTRVFASKMIVVAVGALALAVAGNAVMALLAWGIVRLNKGTMTWPPGTATHVFHTYWRAALLTVSMSLIAAALAFVTRHTAAVIGIIIGWMMIVEGTLIGTIQRLRVYSLITNLEAWITGKATASEYNCDDFGACETIERTITWVHGGVEWGLLTVAVVGLAWLIFARRDVT